MASIETVAAARVVDGRIEDNTKYKYTRKIGVLRDRYLIHSYPNSIAADGKSLKLPLNFPVIMGIFGWLSINTELPRKRATKRKTSGVSSYRRVRTRSAGVGEEDDVIDDSDDEDEDEVNIDENSDEEVREEAQSSRNQTSSADTVSGTATAEGMNMFEFTDNVQTISASCMGGYKSALKWYYSTKNVIFDQQVDVWCDQFIQGYKKQVQRKKIKGVMDVHEGKSAISFEGYQKLAKDMMKIEPEGRKRRWGEGIFAWVYQVFSWCLMCRAVNVSLIHHKHFDVREDHFTIEFPKHKGDQCGEGLGNVKAMYANPVKPWICSFLALSVLILCGGFNKSGFLFHQAHAETYFSKVLLKTVRESEEDLGADKNEIGTHSNRKGCVTFCLQQTFIMAVQVYLRAGWSLGNVQDRYIFAGAGGDECVGRAAAGLPFDNNFGMLPPRFSAQTISLLDEIGWEHIFPDWKKYPARFQRVLKLIFPSLVKHEKFLRETLPHAHPLWSTQLFTSRVTHNDDTFFIIEKFRDKLLDPSNNDGMVATGIPYEIKLGIEMAALRKEINDLRELMPTSFAQLSTEIRSMSSELPGRLKDTLLENFRIDDVNPITTADVRAIIEQNNEQLLVRIRGMLTALRPEEHTEQVAPIEADSQPGSRFRTWNWGQYMGRLVKEPFKFPVLPVKEVFRLWYFGNEMEQIRPYKEFYKLVGKHRPHLHDLLTEACRVNVMRADKVMRAITVIAQKRNIIEVDDFSVLDTDRALEVFDEVFPIFVEEIYKDKSSKARRPEQIMYVTYANLMSLSNTSRKKKPRKVSSKQSSDNA